MVRSHSYITCLTVKVTQYVIHPLLNPSIFLSIGIGGFDVDILFWSWLFRYIHVISGVMWIGLLWYFNFVQVPNMSKITDEQKPAITKVIAPAALFWFRWAAFATIVTGLIVAYLNGYVHQAMMLGIGSGGGKNTAIGIGMWLGLIMAFNVWFIIWPNQKKALGIVECSPEEKPKAAKTAPTMIIFYPPNLSIRNPTIGAAKLPSS